MKAGQCPKVGFNKAKNVAGTNDAWTDIAGMNVICTVAVCSRLSRQLILKFEKNQVFKE